MRGLRTSSILYNTQPLLRSVPRPQGNEYAVDAMMEYGHTIGPSKHSILLEQNRDSRDIIYGYDTIAILWV